MGSENSAKKYYNYIIIYSLQFSAVDQIQYPF
jgi:hypothetical protein